MESESPRDDEFAIETALGTIRAVLSALRQENAALREALRGREERPAGNAIAAVSSGLAALAVQEHLKSGGTLQFASDPDASERERSLGTWIPVTERLPDSERLVIVATATGRVVRGCYFRRSRLWSVGGEWVEGGVTHWMDFPAHPDKERPR